MHNSFFVLAKIADEINEKLQNQRINECFTQQKDELIIIFETETLKIKCHNQSQNISISQSFHRKNSNTVDLFPQIIDSEVEKAEIAHLERAILIKLNNLQTLVLKMFGNRSNILLYENSTLKTQFRQHIPENSQFEFKKFELEKVKFEFENFTEMKKAIPVFPKEVLNELKAFSGEQLNQETKTSFFQLFDSKKYFILQKNEQIKFSMMKFENWKVLEEYSSFQEAYNQFLKTQFAVENYKLLFFENRKKLLSQVQKLENQIKSAKTGIQNIQNARNSEEIANIIMANLHAIPKNTKKIKLLDFYQNTEIEIRLDEKFSAVENAEKFYKKNKKRKIQSEQLENQLVEAEKKLEKAQKLLSEINEFEISGTPDFKLIKSLKKFLKSKQLLNESSTKTKKQTLFREFEFGNWQIYVGKNAQNSDTLSFQFAKPQDLWLHVKDFTGSHVLIKNNNKKPIPKDIIEFAAKLAAYFSKARKQTWVPVSFTPKKNIRKKKGMPAGKVIVQKEEIIFVNPQEAFED